MQRSVVLGTMAFGLLAACGGGSDLLLPGAGDPASVTVVQGDQQNGRVGEVLAQPLVVTVADASGRPVAGATVVFVLTDPAPGAALTPDTTTTNADGLASSQVLLGTRPGAQAGEVQALGAQGQPTAQAQFTATALSESAYGIAAVWGDSESGPVWTSLPQPLVVEVQDAFGNPVPGVTVAWTVDGGGSVSAATTVTGDDGRTSVERTLGDAAGTQRTLASAEGLAGSPVTFVHTATAGAAQGVGIVAGDGQTGPVNRKLPTDLVVEVRDADHNPVPGVAVTWVVGEGGGSVSPTSSATDAGGRASTSWTLGAAPGRNTVSAVVSGIGVAGFTATATGGGPSRLSLLVQPSATATSGVPLAQAPVVQLLDPSGNPAGQSGVQVKVAIATGGGSLEGATSRSTDAIGRATVDGLGITGPAGSRTLQFTADGFDPVTSAAIAVAAPPAPVLAIERQPPAQATLDQPLDPGPTLRLRAANGDEIRTPGVTITASIASGGGTLSGATAVTDAEGVAEFTALTIGGDPGARTLTFTATDYASVTSTAFDVVAPAPVPDPTQSSVTAAPDTVTAGGTSAVTAVVRDAGGAPLAGVTVVLNGGVDPRVSPASAVTAADGTATFTFTSTEPGDAVLSATAAGVALPSLTITVLPAPTTSP
jgi:adhesin/invasin